MTTILDLPGDFGASSRPARTITGRQPWAKNPTSGGANDGTRLDATFVNDLIGLIRYALDTYSITATPGDDTALVQAIQAAATAAAGSVGAGKLSAASNLSDLANAATARTNLGLGSLATASSITASQISDASANGRSFIQAANYAAMKTLLSLAVADVSGAAPLASPTFTGTPSGPTAAAGTNTTQFATTAFVQTAVAAIATGMDYKDPVAAMTTANVTLSGGAPNTVDSVSTTVGMRILVGMAQTAGAERGIYTVQTVGTGANGTWVRATDADANAEVTQGLTVFVVGGSTNGGKLMTLTTPDPITVGTTALTFVQTNSGTVLGYTPVDSASLATGIQTWLTTPSSANLRAAVTDETGTGSLVFATSPTLVTPNLGTPSAMVGTNVTGLPLSTGVTGTLGPTNGGTGIATYAAGDLIYGSGVNTLAKLAAGTNGQVLTLAGGVPTWAASSGLPSGVTSPGTGQLAFAGGTVTASTPMIDLAQTWNAGGATFVGENTDVTLTAAASGSVLRDWKTGGTSRIAVAYVPGTGNFATAAGDLRLRFGANFALANTTGYGATLTNAAGTAGANLTVGALISLGFGQVSSYFSAGGVEINSGSWRSALQTVWLLSANGMSWSNSSSFSGAVDLTLAKAASKVLSLEGASATGATFRTIPTTPAQIAANQNNYAPGGTSYWQRWSGNAARTVTGLSLSQVDGQNHLITNVGGFTISLSNESASSTAANRFTTPDGIDFDLLAGRSVLVVYDGTTSRWRIIRDN